MNITSSGVNRFSSLRILKHSLAQFALFIEVVSPTLPESTKAISRFYMPYIVDKNTKQNCVLLPMKSWSRCILFIGKFSASSSKRFANVTLRPSSLYSLLRIPMYNIFFLSFCILIHVYILILYILKREENKQIYFFNIKVKIDMKENLNR